MKQVKRQNGKLVLGDGEVTGNLHTIRDSRAKLFTLNEEQMLLRLSRPALLRHEHNDVPAEHRDIRLPVGEPVISHKRQYQPGGWTRVQD